jgi:hypothetical protein
MRVMKLRSWNCGIKLWWYRLWIRRDEFHPSLDTDFDALSVMKIKEQKNYIQDLRIRKGIAHERGLKRMDNPGLLSSLCKKNH